MQKKLTASAAAVLALALAVPAFAGGAHCSGSSNASAMANKSSCSDKASASNTAWAGAWLERSASGKITVADVAKNSPAHRAGIKSGDVVLAVNGYDLADKKSRESCASSAECNVGSAVTYKVQRGNSVKKMKVTLEKMPADAASRFANRGAEFDPVFAAVIVSAN